MFIIIKGTYTIIIKIIFGGDSFIKDISNIGVISGDWRVCAIFFGNIAVIAGIGALLL